RLLSQRRRGRPCHRPLARWVPEEARMASAYAGAACEMSGPNTSARDTTRGGAFTNLPLSEERPRNSPDPERTTVFGGLGRVEPTFPNARPTLKNWFLAASSARLRVSFQSHVSPSPPSMRAIL